MKRRYIIISFVYIMSIAVSFSLSACHGYSIADKETDDSSICIMNMQIENHTLKTDWDDFQSITVKPHHIKAEEGKAFAELLLGNVDFIDTSFFPEINKASLEEKITRLEWLKRDEIIVDLYGEGQLGTVKEFIQEAIYNLRNTVNHAQDETPEIVCDWRFHPQSYYATANMNALDDNGNNVIMAFANHDEAEYKIWVTSRDEDDFDIQNIFVYLTPNYASPLDIETLYMIRKMCGYQKPSDYEVEQVIEKANDIVNSVEIGEWTIADCKVEEYKYWRNNQNPAYVINVTAVPCFGGYSSLHVKQLETLRNENSSMPNYYYSELLLTFSSSGKLIEASLTSPVDIVSIVESSIKTIDLQQACEILNSNAQKIGVKILSTSGLDRAEGYMVEILVDNIDQGLVRIQGEANADNFIMIPALKFSGDYKIIKNGETLFSYRDMVCDNYQVALINLIDGSIIN